MSLIIKISQNGHSQEFIFNKLGPIFIGSDPRCDLHLNDPKIEAKFLEVKVSGGSIYVKEVGSKARVYLNAAVLPFREEVKYSDGEVISLKDTSYRISIKRGKTSESIEPPPFFDGDFKERLEKLTVRIKEKEVDLRQLDDREHKKKSQIADLEEKYHRHINEKLKMEVEVNTLKSQKDAIAHDLRKSRDKFQEHEEKVVQLKETLARLEIEEKSLKDIIVAQNLVLSNLRDDREKKAHEVEKQKKLLSEVEVETFKAQEELRKLREACEGQEREAKNETQKIQKILASSQEAMKEAAKIQAQIAEGMKQKAQLDYEVDELQSTLKRIETQRKDAQNKLFDLKTKIEQEETRSRKLLAEIARQQEEESNLRNINGELREEMAKLEEKLSTKKNQLNQMEFQNQEAIRKLATANFDLDRTTQRLRDLQSEEKTQELKIMAVRDEFFSFVNKTEEDKKSLAKAIDEERTKLELELGSIRREIESEKKSLAQLESQKSLASVTLEEVSASKRSLNKEKSSIEENLQELKSSRSQVEEQIKSLREEAIQLQHQRDHAFRELSLLKSKLSDCEVDIREAHEAARIEMENMKRDERAKLQAEKDVHLAEIEAFKQKSLIEVEGEFRRKEEELHNKRQQALREVDQIISEARRTELSITEEANKRLRLATIEAQERESVSHVRIKEAQDFFKEKEREAEALLQKTKLEARELFKQAEAELLDDLTRRKTKIKKFLTMKQEKGQAHVNAMIDQHVSRIKKNERRSSEKLEEIKRKELKKVARIVETEMTKYNEQKEKHDREMRSWKERALKDINEFKKKQEEELAERKKSMMEHINQSKFRSQKTWEEEIRREREAFEATKKERMANATQAVLNVLISELGPQGEKEANLKMKVRSTLEMAIDGQKASALKEMDQILDFNPTKRKRALPVLKKYALHFGVPAAAAIIIFADIGSVRTGSVSFVKELLRQQHSASEIYVNQQKTEWKEKHTYNPEQTLGYKATYVDNIIYTKDFELVMEDEIFQNDWILQVNDYIVNQLELSEDVAINFISAEGTLLKELQQARKELHPQFLDQGLKKMHDLESQHLGWMQEKLAEGDKLPKFNSFRKEYYENYYSEKFGSKRGLAGDKK